MWLQSHQGLSWVAAWEHSSDPLSVLDKWNRTLGLSPSPVSGTGQDSPVWELLLARLVLA